MVEPSTDEAAYVLVLHASHEEAERLERQYGLSQERELVPIDFCKISLPKPPIARGGLVERAALYGSKRHQRLSAQGQVVFLLVGAGSGGVSFLNLGSTDFDATLGTLMAMLFGALLGIRWAFVTPHERLADKWQGVKDEVHARLVE